MFSIKLDYSMKIHTKSAQFALCYPLPFYLLNKSMLLKISMSNGVSVQLPNRCICLLRIHLSSQHSSSALFSVDSNREDVLIALSGISVQSWKKIVCKYKHLHMFAVTEVMLNLTSCLFVMVSQYANKQPLYSDKAYLRILAQLTQKWKNVYLK